MSRVGDIGGNNRVVSQTVSWIAHFLSTLSKNTQEMNIVQS